MRKPTTQEVKQYIEVIKKMSKKAQPKTELGLLRIVAKYFHCSVKDIKEILGN